MNPLDILGGCRGSWSGTYILQDPGTNLNERSAVRLILTRVVGARFVRLDYTWTYKDRPQEGTALIGFDPATQVASMYWADTWHMGHAVMACTGSCDAAGIVDVRGSYAAPPGPDWGWRTVMTPGPEDLRLAMYNVWPEGREDVAVTITATRDRV